MYATNKLSPNQLPLQSLMMLKSLMNVWLFCFQVVMKFYLSSFLLYLAAHTIF